MAAGWNIRIRAATTAPRCTTRLAANSTEPRSAAASASVALLPSIVPAGRLADANARLLGTHLVGNQFLGTLLGGGLASALGITAPFWFASGAVAVLTLTTWRRCRPDALTPSPAADLDGR